MSTVTSAVTPPIQGPDASLGGRFRAIRRATEDLAAPLSPEDQTVQSMPDASPTKWHLAHTTWFFETFVLRPHVPGYRVFDPAYEYLFNSYYEAVGPRHPRPQRGLVTRPGVDEVMAYRRHVTRAMDELLTRGANGCASLIELGLHHEQQHQELILMDIKHALSCNPLLPAYAQGGPAPSGANAKIAPSASAGALAWHALEGGLVEIGHAGQGFAFDNEGPRHRVWLDPFRIATRPVTCGEYLAFIADGGYRRAEFWLSAGWDCVNRLGWEAPLYWRKDSTGWSGFTLAGARPVEPADPVCHVSYFEAAAFAKWAGRRLPREQEWETAATAPDGPGLQGAKIEGIGQVWEWTASPYVAYPGYREPPGAVGEYNGKFMASQMVLRGGCVATPPGHARPTYRNFFPPEARWMFGGIRLAEDLS